MRRTRLPPPTDEDLEAVNRALKAFDSPTCSEYIRQTAINGLKHVFTLQAMEHITEETYTELHRAAAIHIELYNHLAGFINYLDEEDQPSPQIDLFSTPPQGQA